MSLAIWDHTVLPATRHKRTHPALTQPCRPVLDLPTPGDGRLSWPIVDLIAPRSGVEPATFQSRVQRSTTAPPRQPGSCIGRHCDTIWWIGILLFVTKMHYRMHQIAHENSKMLRDHALVHLTTNNNTGTRPTGTKIATRNTTVARPRPGLGWTLTSPASQKAENNWLASLLTLSKNRDRAYVTYPSSRDSALLLRFRAPSIFPRIPDRTKKCHILRSQQVSDQLNNSSACTLYIFSIFQYSLCFVFYCVLLDAHQGSKKTLKSARLLQPIDTKMASVGWKQKYVSFSHKDEWLRSTRLMPGVWIQVDTVRREVKLRIVTRNGN